MLKAIKTVSYRVADLEKAKHWYRQFFDRDPVFDSPFAVVFAAGDASLALVPASPQLPERERVVAYWDVDDIDAVYRRLLDSGATPLSEIRSALKSRNATVVDPFGNVLGVTSASTEARKTTLDVQPSDSARVVAFCRALATTDEPEEIRGPDYLAEIFLPEDARMALKDRTSREFIRHKLMTPGSYEYFIPRTLWFDSMVRTALQQGIPQIVFLGAGYDSRAYRFQDLIRDTRIFELDIESTQQRKKTLLAQANVQIPGQLTFVPIDFTRDKLEDVLGGAGFDKTRKTLFIWEGVTYYLPASAIDGTLEFIRSHSAAGSVVCFDYMIEAPDISERYGVKEALAAMRAVYVSEPVQFRIEEGAIESFLRTRGFSLTEHLSPSELEERYLTLKDGSRAKVMACFALVSASVT